MSKEMKVLTAPIKIIENESSHMSFGKCNDCMFVSFGKFMGDPSNWGSTKVYMHCDIYDESIQLTKCIRDSEEKYAKHMNSVQKDFDCDHRKPVGFAKDLKKKDNLKDEEV